jgi:hypothetical protein
MQSANQLAQTAIDARSEVRESYSAYVTSYDVAKHYRDEVVPLRKTISDELLLRYNGMLASVFDLLADSREQVGAVNSYIDALKDYWLAETDLQQAVGGRLPQAGDKQFERAGAATTGSQAPQQHAARASIDVSSRRNRRRQWIRKVNNMVSRRQFLSGSGAALLGAAMVSKAGAASLPEAPTMAKATTQPPLVPPNGRPTRRSRR